MEILIEPTSNKLLVGDLCNSIRIKLVTTGKKGWCDSIRIKRVPDAPVMRTASAAAKPYQGDSSKLYLITGSTPDDLHASNTPCRYSAIRPRDEDDPYDDAHPEGENSAKRQKTSEHETYVMGESSSGQANESEPGPSTSGNQEQLDDFDFWTDKYATDDDELPTENVSQELVEEMSEIVDEAKLRKVVDEMLRQR
ncbi:hypothetical protein Tco_1302360 [Tanacetum coccineum]